ncbi:MAG: ribbon-helix-helix protein, CopG family, partial [Deltaproteobacteria bacterium]|nr:ribbon-helix-helix protein, CopG family [Deltaproteobacteria bacterium]
MATQIIIRIPPEVKDRFSKLARMEGKTASQMVRELIEDYIKERNIGTYADDLWSR